MFSKKVTEYYIKNPQYRTHPDNYKFLNFHDGDFLFCGIEDKTARFIEEIQLKDKSLWKILVKQFKDGNVDIEDLGWRGEYWGKLMRGACITYQYTKNNALYETLEETIRDLLDTQDENGRFSTYTEDTQYNGWDIWCRKYIALGILHFIEICKDENLKSDLLEAVCRHMDYIVETIGNGKKEINQTSNYWGCANSVSILEPFVRLYNQTRIKKYLDFAEYIIETGPDGCDIFELAFEGKTPPYKWSITKAYELMSCFEGLLEYYMTTGIEKHKTSVINFTNLIKETDISIIGCSGCVHELFDNSFETQTYTENKRVMQETCVSVTWMKLCYRLLNLTGDSSYADEIEKTIYNALYGAVNTEQTKNNNGFPFDSYSPLLMQTRGRATGGYKLMENGTTSYGCCAAIGAAGTGLVPLSAVQATNDGIVINFYMNGSANITTPLNNKLCLKLQTKYPADGNVKIEVNPTTAENFGIMLRIPEFAKNTTVLVNGNIIPCKNGTYCNITREWNIGDVITLNIDMNPRVIHPKGYKNDENSIHNIAVKYGPLVLARDKRLGENIGTVVDLNYQEDNSIQLTPSNKADFPTICEFKIPQKDGSSITMIDYSSAGKTWDENSLMEAWMPTKKYDYYIKPFDIR